MLKLISPSLVRKLFLTSNKPSKNKHLLYCLAQVHLKLNFISMKQASITRFFMSTKQVSPDEKETSEKKDSDASCDSITPSKKRPATDVPEDDKPTKRVALLATPCVESVTKENSDNQPPTTPLRSPARPLIDTRIVIRKKIASGSFALHENIGTSWFKALQAEFDKPYFKKLSEFVKQQREKNTVFPPEHKVYSWTHHHKIQDVRVVILGQDPYHGPNQAHGLSFSVQKGVKIPPSLVNIFKELSNDCEGFVAPNHGELTGWAKQGVLMLNTCLTVNQGQAASHQNHGWETFTSAVISCISRNPNSKIVFMLWGKPAQRKKTLIDANRHLILEAAHPSPLSAHQGFFGCKHFSKANAYLSSKNLTQIDWKAL